MWQNPRLVFQSTTTQRLNHYPPLPPIQIQNSPISPSPPPSLKLSRRLLTKSPFLLLLLGSQPLDPLHPHTAQAEEEPPPNPNPIENPQQDNSNSNTTTTIDIPNPIENTQQNNSNATTTTDIPSPVENTQKNNSNTTTANTDICTDKFPTKRAFLDVSINGEPVGRIIIGLYPNSAPAGTARFIDLVTGSAGISYRRKEFIKIMPNYVQHGGVRSYGVDAEMAKKTGGNLAVDNLIAELEKLNGECGGKTRNLGKSVGIIVRDPAKPPPKLKLVARKGKLEIDEEEVGMNPNGTEFVIVIRDSPELDAAVLVVGRVVEGMEVVERIGEVKTVQENTTSPYFRVAKLIGDKRAVVAERGFNRPYSKVVITNCGLIE